MEEMFSLFFPEELMVAIPRAPINISAPHLVLHVACACLFLHETRLLHLVQALIILRIQSILTLLVSRGIAYSYIFLFIIFLRHKENTLVS